MKARIRRPVPTLRTSAALAAALVALLCTPAPVALSDVRASGVNVQEGDNSAVAHQRGEATSGDAISGEVVGLVGSGQATVSVSNVSTNASARSGDVSGSNNLSVVVGLEARSSAARVTSGSSALSADFVVASAPNALVGPVGPLGPADRSLVSANPALTAPFDGPVGPPGPQGPLTAPGTADWFSNDGVLAAARVAAVDSAFLPMGPPGPAGPGAAG